jgi:hypothetical protein
MDLARRLLRYCAFGYLVQEHAVSAPLQGMSNLLSGLFAFEWANAYPIILSCRPITWADIGLWKPGLYLVENCMSLLAILKRSDLDLKIRFFIGAGLLSVCWRFGDRHPRPFSECQGSASASVLNSLTKAYTPIRLNRSRVSRISDLSVIFSCCVCA